MLNKDGLAGDCLLLAGGEVAVQGRLGARRPEASAEGPSLLPGFERFGAALVANLPVRLAA